MVKHALKLNISNITNYSDQNMCVYKVLEIDRDKKEYEGTFEWDSNMQGFILSSYFYGYMCFQVS